MEIIHHAVLVDDIDDTLDFWVDGLGFEKTNDFESGDGARNVYVRGDGGAEIQFKSVPDREEPLPDPTVYDHVALGVDDTDAAVERLTEETDCTLQRGPLDSEGANARVAFLDDPNGYGIELVEEFD